MAYQFLRGEASLRLIAQPKALCLACRYLKQALVLISYAGINWTNYHLPGQPWAFAVLMFPGMGLLI